MHKTAVAEAVLTNWDNWSPCQNAANKSQNVAEQENAKNNSIVLNPGLEYEEWAKANWYTGICFSA